MAYRNQKFWEIAAHSVDYISDFFHKKTPIYVPDISSYFECILNVSFNHIKRNIVKIVQNTFCLSQMCYNIKILSREAQNEYMYFWAVPR